MKTFYFDTGVKPGFGAVVMPGYIVRGTIQIPFDCENVPKNAIFKYACDNDTPPHPNMISRKIYNSSLLSKYAIFLIP